MPSFSITPGLKFSSTTSAFSASFFTIAMASGLVRSSAMLRLFELIAIQLVDSPRSDHSLFGGP